MATNATINAEIRALLPRPTGVALMFYSHVDSKPPAGLGVDPFTMARTPAGERERIEINADDELAGALKRLLGLLKGRDELLPGFRQIVGVFEDGEEGLVIFLPAPRNADRN